MLLSPKPTTLVELLNLVKGEYSEILLG